jgi:STE24 endopeptidase
MKLLLLALVALTLLLCAGSAAAAQTSSPDPLKYFTREEIQRARAYHRVGYASRFIGIGVSLTFFLLLIYTGAARRLDDTLSVRLHSYLPRVLVYFVLFFIVYTAVLFPLTLYRSYIIEHRFGFAKQTLGPWLADFLKGNAISLVLGAVLVTGLYCLLKASPRWWWLLAAGAFAVYLAAIILLKPVVIDPVFNKFTPMEDRQTKAEIVALAGRAGIEVGEVLVMDASRRTSHTNAYFTGFGGTKRIVIYDTLIQKHTKPEVLSVIAHEIGHWKYAHIYKGFFMAIAGTVLVLLIVKLTGGYLAPRMPLGTKTLASPATIPLVFLILYVCSLAGAPVENGISRYFERQADRTALELTGDGKTFVQMQVKLTRANASVPEPSGFIYYLFYSHPSPMERIAAGEKYGG